MPVLGRDNVVKLAVVGVDVLTDLGGKAGPAFDGQGSPFAEIVLHVNDDQGAGHSVLLVDGGDGWLAALQPVDHARSLLHGVRMAAAGALDAPPVRSSRAAVPRS